jgi:hypothetical protein
LETYFFIFCGLPIARYFFLCWRFSYFYFLCTIKHLHTSFLKESFCIN